MHLTALLWERLKCAFFFNNGINVHILGIGSFRLVFCMSSLKKHHQLQAQCLLLVCLYNTVHLLLETKVYLNCPIKISALLCFDLRVIQPVWLGCD